MKTTTYFLLAFTLFFAVNCTPGVEKEIAEIDKELMTGHDEVMPKSMKLGNLRDDVLAKAAEGDSSAKTAAVKIANDLQAAEDGMYKWMDDYSVAMNDEQDQTKKLEMYKTLKVEVEKISTDTDNAMKAATDFIGDNATKTKE